MELRFSSRISHNSHIFNLLVYNPWVDSLVALKKESVRVVRSWSRSHDTTTPKAPISTSNFEAVLMPLSRPQRKSVDVLRTQPFSVALARYSAPFPLPPLRNDLQDADGFRCPSDDQGGRRRN